MLAVPMPAGALSVTAARAGRRRHLLVALAATQTAAAVGLAVRRRDVRRRVRGRTGPGTRPDPFAQCRARGPRRVGDPESARFDLDVAGSYATSATKSIAEILRQAGYRTY